MQIKVINYMKWRHVAIAISMVLVLASLVSLATKGIVFGLDFTGGTQVEVGFSEPADLERVRSQLENGGFENPVAVHFGSDRDVLIKLKSEPMKGMDEKILSAVLPVAADPVVKRLEFVGPQVGDELRERGLLAVFISLLGVMLYVSVRFQYKFAVGAGLGMLHDVIVTLGIFSFLGLEFDLTVLAALLAIIGYSVNDTVIIYDRIRENFRLVRNTTPIEIINESLTQVLLRTIYVSCTTLLVCLALFFMGGETIHNFSIVMIIGVVIGTTSSIYVAATTLVAMKLTREDLVPTVKEGTVEYDGLP